MLVRKGEDKEEEKEEKGKRGGEKNVFRVRRE